MISDSSTGSIDNVHNTTLLRFFYPTLRHLIETTSAVTIVCLSDGGYGGLGAARRAEMARAAARLGVASFVADDAALRDGETWLRPARF